MINIPKLACCNFISDVKQLKQFALDHGFSGVDWTFTLEDFPQSSTEESELVKTISTLYPLEIRYHCSFRSVDLGDADEGEAQKALDLFGRACILVSKLQGHYLTIHVGLGRDSTNHLVWEKTVETLAGLVRFANDFGIRICLENLAWGWTSRPHLFEKLVRNSGCWATIDIGHARVSPSIETQHYELEDFVDPHRERCLNAHIYHEENRDCHVPPKSAEDLRARLQMLRRLPACDWWVLELREEKDLLDTLRVVDEFLKSESSYDSSYQDNFLSDSKALFPA
jgi:sugar phosphate isomerase/epimerase